MTRQVLLDTNLLIGALDGDADNPGHQAARDRLAELLQAPDIKLAITPLIRYEVLRGVRRNDVQTLDKVLDGFVELEIRGRHARRAADLYRQAKKQEVLLDKRTFDLFHCVCAELEGFDVASQDGDIPKIQKLIQAK